MATGTISKCISCGYPIEAMYVGQRVSCPMCGSINEAVTQGVTIPTPAFVGILCFFGGMLIGPSLIAGTSGGRDWLEEQTRKAVRK